MRITLAQLNYIVGDITGNAEKIRRTVEEATERESDLVIFSELAICGYPPLDLLERGSFIESSLETITRLATELPQKTGVILGGPEFNPNKEGKLLFNSAYLLYNGKITNVVRKSLLPTYDIFDEYRYFEPGREFSVVEFRDLRIALTICEDLWDEQPIDQQFSRSRLYTRHPLEELVKESPDLVINIAASPYSANRQKVKQDIFTGKSKKHNLPVIMVNQVGANTELIFEGGSLVTDQNGQIAHRMSLFSEEIYDLDFEELRSGNMSIPDLKDDRIAQICDALILGIRDYFQKSGFTKATLGLSGGIDSAVTLALAAEALGPENLYVLLMPSQYSSDHSISDSEQMADGLKVAYDTLSIREIFNIYREVLKPVFKDRAEGLAEENIQSRIRGTLLMALSNKLGHILLNTSNKSETAVGYGTLYGDMAGGLSVLGDVYKTDVYRIAKYLNRNKEIIPENIINKPPSAELKPDQKDSDSLPDYDVLDEILEQYIEKQSSANQIITAGYDEEIVKKVIRLVDQNEYKRYQTPPILRISNKAFGVGRRIPIVGRY